MRYAIMADDDRIGHPPGQVPAPAPPVVSGRLPGNGDHAAGPALPPIVGGHFPGGAVGRAVPSPEAEGRPGGEPARDMAPVVSRVPDAGDEAEDAFPLDAFYIPEDSDRIPMGMDPDSPRGEHGARPSAGPLAVYGAADVAARLEELAARLRSGGTPTAVGWAGDEDPLRRALGQALARFLPQAPS